MKYVKLGDICSKICSGGTPPSSKSEYYDGIIPWLNTNEVNFCNIYSTNRTITEEGLKNSSAKYVPVNTVIVAMYGVTAGKCAIAKIPLTTNQACCNLVIDKKKADYRYVYYYLKLQSANLNRLAIGGAQQNLNVITIKKYKVALPPLPIQRKIASILSAYDNLIENNAKRIKLLEQMAENLYKEWFVRFRFPGHEHVEMVNGLPKGWKAYKIKDICDINKRTVNTKNAPLTIKYLDTSSITKSSISELQEMLFKESPSRARRMVKENSIVYSTVRPNLKHFGILKCLPTNLIVSTGFAVLDCKDDIANIVYLALASEEMTSYCSSIAEGAVATYPSIKAEELGKITIILPPIEIAEKMNCKLELFLGKINYLELQSQLLTRQRDLLLPRLMSGKLEVKL